MSVPAALDDPPDSGGVVELREAIRASKRIRRLPARWLSAQPPGVYANWQGAQWVLAALADLGYPVGDAALHPLREQVLRLPGGTATIYTMR